MVSLFHYTGDTGHIGSSLQDFYAAIERLDASYRSGEIQINQLLGKLAGLYHDKTTGELRDSDLPEKAKCMTDKLVELAAQQELGRYAETWFIVEVVSYTLRRAQEPEAYYRFIEEKMYMAPYDALNNFNAIFKNGYPIVPRRMVRLMGKYFISCGGCRMSLEDFEQALTRAKEPH